MTTVAIIVAAGKGNRAGGKVPKQWRKIAGKLVVDWSIDAFKNHSLVDFVIVVLPPNQTLYRDDVMTCVGGKSRSLSVYNGLIAAKSLSPDKVLIHDVARPAVSENIITDIISEIDEKTGAAPGLPITDALWKISDEEVEKTLNRDFIFRAQTPQGFPYSKILEAHENKSDEQAFDDVELAKKSGLKVMLKTGHKDNMKITTPDDFSKMSKILVKKLDIK
jgi:2-C-methyl-D-erythritol 4-phosphate cytidylyltransferase/2-C-methyl-D-erythritol 2,4-cyclodiphosphate synthase